MATSYVGEKRVRVEGSSPYQPGQHSWSSFQFSTKMLVDKN